MTAAAPAPIPAAPLASAPASATPAPSRTLGLERARIDASTSGPVLFFFGSAVLWLLAATVLGLISSVQLHSPEFLAGCPFLTYGRVLPAYHHAIFFGWASQAGIGVGLWLLSRLCRVEMKLTGILMIAALFCNIGLTVGIAQILGGKTSGVEGMELTGGAAGIMFVGYGLVALWAAMIFGLRRQGPAYISVWYLLAAFLWLPWSFGLGYFGQQFSGVQGVMQNVLAAWASHSLLHMWITGVGLAAAYYLIPKVINRPVFSYNLAAIGFWSWLVFGGLTSMVRLSGGPVPAWLVTLSISAHILLIVQIVTVTANLVLTMRGNYHMVYHSPTIRFTFFGAIAFSIASVLGLLASLRSVDRVLHFTEATSAIDTAILYAFFSMAMFGAIYYIMPRLVGCEWLSSSMISLHFWGAAYGGGMAILLLLFGGIATGLTLADPEALFSQVVQIGYYSHLGRTIGLILLSLGHLIFALHFLLMLLRIGQPGGQATLFAPIGDESHT
jgi:cytochrome c oxidase cbb3-type subunit 1